MNFSQKMQKIQEELKAPKNQLARGEKFNFNYRSLEDIFEAIKPILSKYEIYVAITDEIVQIGERYYVKATATLIDDNDSVENTAFAREPTIYKGMNESQTTGSASSYARKYAISGLLAIDDNKDSDGASKNGAKKPKPKQKQNEIVDMAFLAFEAKHQIFLQGPEGYKFSREKFETAIIKHSPTKALPTHKNSIKKILEIVKPEEVYIETKEQ